MKLLWSDSNAIALSLIEKFPDINPMTLNFVNLRNMVIQLEDFTDEPDHCGEKILEGIQLAWLAEWD